MTAVRTLLATALVCAASAEAAWSRTRPDGSAAVHQEAVMILLNAAGRPNGTLDALPREVRDLGSAAVPVLLEAAGTARITIDTGLEHPITLELRAEICAAIVRGLALLPRSEIIGPLSLAAGSDVRTEVREAGLLVLARAGTASDLGLLARLAGGGAGSDLPTPVQRTNFETALTSMLQRQRGVRGGVVALYREAGPALALAILRALEAGLGSEALEVEARLLGVRADDDLLILQQIHRLAARDASPPPRLVVEAVRPFLDDARSEVALMAVRACAELGDMEAIPSLAGLLERPSVAHSARAALRRLTRTDYGASAADWQAWYEGEIKAWGERSAAGLRDLGDGDPAAAVAALKELARCRVYRHEASLLVERALDHEDPGVAALACRVLGHLASPSALAALQDALLHPEAEVSDAARGAIQRIEERRRKPSSRRNAG